ncbi:MAG: hypothetical protein EOP20_05760 [Hyphomicrobiales bacterium]|nr:MAG: hypothetical protein EOP20_05760 [Hyphomicrobiales bacterium]
MIKSALLAGFTSLAALCATTASAQRAGAPLTHVAQFDHQATGVAVTADGRRFVNFPRWTDDAPPGHATD